MKATLLLVAAVLVVGSVDVATSSHVNASLQGAELGGPGQRGFSASTDLPGGAVTVSVAAAHGCAASVNQTTGATVAGYVSMTGKGASCSVLLAFAATNGTQTSLAYLATGYAAPEAVSAWIPTALWVLFLVAAMFWGNLVLGVLSLFGLMTQLNPAAFPSQGALLFLAAMLGFVPSIPAAYEKGRAFLRATRRR